METVKNQKLSVVLPTTMMSSSAMSTLSSIEKAAAAVEVIDPMTPKIATASYDPASPPRAQGSSSGAGGGVPVVTPVGPPRGRPPVIRLEDVQASGVPIPSPPSMTNGASAGMEHRDWTLQRPQAKAVAQPPDQQDQPNAETQEAAVLLASLSAIATKEVVRRIDDGAVADLLSLSSSGSSASAKMTPPPPPFPDLDIAHNQQQQKHQPRIQQPQQQSPAPSATVYRSLALPRESGGGVEDSAIRARAVSIDAFVQGMEAAADLSLPCEPCYRESDDEMMTAEDTSPFHSAPVPGGGSNGGLGLFVSAPAPGGSESPSAVLVSPPSSPAFRPLRASLDGGIYSKSPQRSADRRKRFLDLHGMDYAPSLTESSLSGSPSSSKSRKTAIAAASKGVVAGDDLPHHHRGTLQPVDSLRGMAVRIIARKKFSWKNYPELERFLIANREEYLRHSALNYTVQQKRYNNKLTERLLLLATENGYVFDESDFSFVTVRDRIRCYFKSYVQSSKKRGVVVGYAARRAGLLTRDELERSAGTAGRIVVPGEEPASSSGAPGLQQV